jgi:hypothetical protein
MNPVVREIPWDRPRRVRAARSVTWTVGRIFLHCERRAPEALRGRGATRSTDEASTFAVALPVMMTRSAMSGMKGLVWPKVPLPFMRTIWVGA